VLPVVLRVVRSVRGSLVTLAVRTLPLGTLVEQSMPDPTLVLVQVVVATHCTIQEPTLMLHTLQAATALRLP
jgi:hypothetical protein